MQVYRTFFRILRRHKGYVVLYLCIFLGVALIISSSHASENGRKTWEEVSYPFAVFDEDQTEMSRGLVSCLEEGNEKIEAEDDREMVTDELYEHNLVCVMRIPKGFGASLLTGKEGREVEITAVRGTAYDETFRMLTADYIQLIRYYLSDGCQTAEAVEKAITEVRAKTPVSVGEESSVLHGRAYYFFLYLPFILISICVAALGPTIMAFQRQEIRYRSRCSACPETRISIEIVAASVTAGLGLCLIYFLLVLVGTGEEVLSFQGILYSLNMVSFLPAALGITFLVGQILHGHSAIVMAANIIGLGMSFLGGVFAPVDYLGEGLAKAAHLLPVYWYTLGNNWIDHYMPGDSLSGLWQCMGIEILSGAALVCAGLAYARSKIQAKTI